MTGIGPATTAWKAVVLPLNYTRVNGPCWARTNDRMVMSRLLELTELQVRYCLLLLDGSNNLSTLDSDKS